VGLLVEGLDVGAARELGQRHALDDLQLVGLLEGGGSGGGAAQGEGGALELGLLGQHHKVGEEKEIDLALVGHVQQRALVQEAPLLAAGVQHPQVAAQLGLDDAQRLAALRLGVHVHRELLQLRHRQLQVRKVGMARLRLLQNVLPARIEKNKQADRNETKKKKPLATTSSAGPAARA